MKFFSRSDLCTDKFCSPCGDRYEPVYDYRIVNGKKCLCDTGERSDLYEFIQSNAEQCDIKGIISRCTDVSSLCAKVTQFFDASSLPDNMQDFLNLRIKLETNFQKLPISERAKFGNNLEYYISNLGVYPESPIDSNEEVSENV